MLSEMQGCQVAIEGATALRKLPLKSYAVSIHQTGKSSEKTYKSAEPM